MIERVEVKGKDLIYWNLTRLRNIFFLRPWPAVLTLLL